MRSLSKAMWLVGLAMALVACDGGGSGSGSLPGGGVGLNQGQAMKAAVRLATCSGEPAEDLAETYMLVSGAMYGMFGVSDSMWDAARCISGASSCDAVFACYGVDPSTTCDISEYVRTCESDTMITECEGIDDKAYDGHIRTASCSEMTSLNPKCVTDTDGEAHCGVGNCEEGTTSRCDGDALEFCWDGVLMRQDCSASGGACVESEEGARCGVPAGGTPCESTCDGDRAIDCYEGLLAAVMDCNEVDPGLTCILDDEGEPRCGPTSGENECSSDEPDQCEGTVTRHCISGIWFESDCGEFGASCEIRNNSAYCVK